MKLTLACQEILEPNVILEPMLIITRLSKDE